MPKAFTAEVFFDRLKNKLSVMYLGKGKVYDSEGRNTGTAHSVPFMLRPFKVMHQMYVGRKARGKKTDFNTMAKEYGKFLGKRAIQGPLLNIVFLGVPFIIYFGSQMQREFGGSSSGGGGENVKGSGSGKGRFGGQSTSVKEKPIALKVPEVEIPVGTTTASNGGSTSRPKLTKSHHLPHMPHADVATKKIFHQLILLGMSEDNARAFAVGVFEDHDLMELVEAGTLSESDLEALSFFFDMLQPD